MYVTEYPYVVTGTKKISVTTTSQPIDFQGKTAIVQNLGSGALFISNADPATTNDFKLASGDRISVLTGVVNFVSDSTADVRVLYVDAFGI